MSALIGRRADMKIGRYQVLDEIGEGAMGRVYRAYDPLIERTVAIKTVPIAQLQQEGQDAESRFLREAQSAGRLSHPNIVTIYDIGETESLAYIAMEYLPGATLRDLMNKGPMPLDLVLDTAIQMAEALAFAHEHGVTHRDIKPANVVITGKRGRIKLTDFGIAHLANSDRTHAGQMLGSPRYMSPEQAMGREVDGRSDIFSLGAVLYEMLTGRYAFDGDSLPAILYRVINQAPVAASSLRPHIPEALVHLLGRMLSKAPTARPDARALVSALHSLASPAPRPPATAMPDRIPRLLPALAFGTPIGVFLLIGVGIVFIDYFVGASTNVYAPSASTNRTAPPAYVAPSVSDAPAENAAAPANSNASSPPARRRATPATGDAYLLKLDEKQTELRIRRTELLLKYTELHPDVVQIDRQLEQLRDERRRHLNQQR